MLKNDRNKQKLIFIDILRGYSCSAYNNKKIYIKHHTNFDAGDLDYKKEEFRDKALKNGLPSLENQSEYIIKEGFWSEEKDKEITTLRNFIFNLKQTKSKLFKESDIKQIQSSIEENNKKMNDLIKEKKELLGFTVEDYVSKKVNEYYMFISLFKDIDLKESFFDQEEFDDLENIDIYKLINIYNNISQDYSEVNLKRISLSSSFLGLFNLCEDNVYNLYGKGAIFLTFYQIELFSFAKYFKNVINNAKHKPPDDYYEDPDKLIEWLESSKNMEEVLDKTSKNSKNKDNNAVVATSVVGATKQDLKKAGLDQNKGISLVEEAAKKGGVLDMQDLMKLHGL